MMRQDLEGAYSKIRKHATYGIIHNVNLGVVQ
jgi:hypothetical protein